MDHDQQPENQEWVEVVGGFIMNFGAIEFLIINLIHQLSIDPIIKDIAIDLPINKRLSLLCDLIKRSKFPEDQKQKALGLFGQVGKLLATRNILAHGPFITNRPTGDRGFIDIKELKGPSPFKLKPLRFIDIAKAGKETGVILEKFTEIGWMQNSPNIYAQPTPKA